MTKLNHHLFAGLILIVFWLPIPLGSDLPWARILFEIFSIGLLLIALGAGHVRSATAGVMAEHRLPLSLLGLWVAYQLFQLAPLPPSWVAAVRPLRGEEMSENLTQLTINPSASIEGILFNIACIALMFLAVLLIDTRDRLKRMLIALTVIGTLHAIYALLVYATDGALSFFEMPKAFDNPHVFSTATRGTFISYNHFVDLMVVCLAFALTWFLMIASRSRKGTSRGGDALELLDDLLSRQPLAIAAMSIIMAALLMSTSRGGFISFVVTFSSVPLAVWLRRRITKPAPIASHPIRTRLLYGRAWLILIPMLLALLANTAGGLLQRFENQEFQLSGRDKMFLSTIELIKDHPLAGSGTNTFFEAHQSYKNKELSDAPYVWPHAHSGYLELLAEQGIIGLALLGSAILLFLAKFFKFASSRNMSVARYSLLGVLLGTTMMLIHAIAEYNFQIPALAAYFFLMLGIGMSASKISH